MTPRYIVFEGVDASGKTTAAKWTAEWLGTQGVDAVYTRHPGSTQFGKRIRQITHDVDVKLHHITEALIFTADQNEFLEQILKPSLKDDMWVIADRNNFVSGIAYQMASGCSFDDMDRVQATIIDPPKIDLVIILHAPKEVLAERARLRGNDDRFEALMREGSYSSKVIDAYQKMLDHDPEIDRRLMKFVRSTVTVPEPLPRVIGVDSNRSVEEVFEEIKTLMQPLIKD